jgi:hypothetical protein
MTAVNFPSSPSNGDTLTSGNTTYTYNSTKTRWDAVTTVNGIQLNSLSVGAEAAASGDGGIAYDNTSGEFTYTPPVTGDSLPSQTDNSGKFLTTNGTAASWATVSAGAGYAIGDGLELNSVSAVSWPASPNLISTINGSAASKQLGYNIAASADYVVAGYIDHDRVEVYNARTGAFLRSIICPNGAGHRFGKHGIDIDGTNLIVGAPGANKAYIFDITNGSTLQTFSSSSVEFGIHVSIKGNYAAVADYHTSDSDWIGKFTVYNVTTGSQLYVVNNPNAGGGDAGDNFAKDGLDMTASYIVTAGWREDTGASGSGTAYVFDISNGTLLATVLNPNPVSNGFFGYGIAADGDYLGVYGGIVNNSNVYVYSLSALVANASASPIYTINNPSPDGNTGDQFGYASVSIAGPYMAVGAKSEDVGSGSSGSSYLYDLSDGSLLYTINGAAGDDNMGWASAVGIGVFVTGSPQNDSGGSNNGSIGIYNGTVSSTSYLQPDSTIATTSYVDTSVSNLVDSSPAALNTLNELAAALGDDANFSTTVTNSIAAKADASATTSSLAAKAPLADPTFTGVPVAPTAAAGTNTTQLATTAFVAAAAGDSLPTQSGNTGKFLTTNGTAASWATVSAGAGYEIGDGLELETVTASDWSTLPAATASIVGSVAGQQFGAYIASSNSHLAVLSQGPTNTFSVYNAQTGSFERSITKPGGSNYNGSIGVSGTKIIFGDDGANATYIFEATTGALVHNLSSTGSSLRGISSAISPTYAATSSLSYGNIDAYVDVHSVVTGNKLYTLTNPDIVPTGGSATFDDHYGSGLSISDSYLVVGAYQEEGAGGTTGSGAVYVYDTPTGTLLHTLTPTSPINSGNYGSYVSVDGDYIAVGSNNMNTVFIYSASTGSLLRTIAAPSGGAAFGRSVSVNGNYLLVGQPHSSSFAGSAFLFNITDGSLLHTIVPGYSTSQFGGAVVLAQSVIAIAGQFYDNGGSADVGIVDLYNTTSTTTTTLQPDSTIATTSSLAAKAPLADPTFTGVPAAPTAAAGTNTTQLATTAFVAAANFETKTYAYEGALEVHTGVKRLYAARTYTLSSVDAHLATAASGASVIINIKKNNVVAATLSLGAGSTSSLSNAFSVSLTQGDYLTIDITQIGSTTAGTDLYLTLTLTQ